MFQTRRTRMTSPGKSCDQGERQDDYRERDQYRERQHSTPGPSSSSRSSKGTPSRALSLKESTRRLARKCGAVKGISGAPETRKTLSVPAVPGSTRLARGQSEHQRGFQVRF